MGSGCNSNPDTFSVWFCAISPIRCALGPGQGGSSGVTSPVSGVSGVPGGSGGGATGGGGVSLIIVNCSGA